MRTAYSLLILLLCCSFFQTKATNVSGTYYNNVNWTLANSPYIVTGDLVVFADLTIDSGVQVLVDSMVKIEIRGRLQVNGTAQSEVVIKGNTNTDNDYFWIGLVFAGNKTSPSDTLQADFKYCRISNAYEAISRPNGGKPPYNFRYCTFTHNRYVSGASSIAAFGGAYDHCTFKYAQTALKYPGATINYCFFDSNQIGFNGQQQLENCKFTHHSQCAIYYAYDIKNCEIKNNNIGIWSPIGQTYDSIIDNEIMNNDTGILIWACGFPSTLVNNKICSNNYNIVHSTANNCDFPHNCWCTMDSTAVHGKIYDGYANTSLGLISFMPMDSACNPTTVRGIPAENTVGVNIYPNPSNGTFILQLPNTNFQNANVQVYDMVGRECYRSTVANSKTEIILNQPKGIYMVKLQLDEAVVTKRVVVE